MKLGKNKKNTDDKKTFFNGAWKEVELIGEGSYGKVYKAKKEEFGVVTYSAIKQIEIPKMDSEIKNLKSEGMTNAEITKYFEKSVGKWVEEINFMAIFKDSENIVNIEDYEVLPKEKNIGWIINIRMELLNNLESYIYEHNITDKDILKMAIDVTNALEDCEENNVVHRDIKPDNIFVNKKGVYKVGDFGIAKKIETSASNMSKKGTDNYMAPELYKNERGNKTVDIYSLGIMLYRFFNYNRLPFLPDYPNEITPEARENALYMRIAGEKMYPPINAPREIAEIILKACNYYSKDRYQSATELKEDLQRVYQGITKSTILFNYNEKQMEKLYKENTKSNGHDATISVLTGTNTNNGTKIKEEEKSKESTEIVEKNDIEKKEDKLVDKELTISEEEDKKENIEKETKVSEKSNNKKEEVSEEKQEEIEGKEPVKKVKKEKTKKEKKEKIVTAIKSKKEIKLKNNKHIIIGSIILLLIIVLVLFFIFRKPKEIYIIVPDVIKLESNVGSEMLTKKGFVIEYEYIETENEEDIDHILEQSIEANTKAKEGTLIKLKVAVSKEQVEVINVVGMTKEEAETKLKEIGLNVNITEQNSDTVDTGKVISQIIEAGTKVNKGAVIELLVSKGKKENKTQTKQKNWSNWVETLPQGVNSSNYNIETKKQYRSSTRTTKTVTEKDYRDPTKSKEVSDTNTAGWNVYDKKVEYIYDDKIYENNTNDVGLNKTKNSIDYKIISYERTYYDVDGTACLKENNTNGSPFVTPLIVNNYVACPDGYSGLGISGPLNYQPALKSIVQIYYNNVKVDIFVKKVQNGYTEKFQLRNYTQTTYYYEKWSDFGNWQDNAITSNNNTKVEERTLYRYKEK